MISRDHWNKVSSYVTIGQDEGATLACGDGKHPAGLEGGNYINPTFFKDANTGMRLAQEEVFGPFLTAFAFDTDDLGQCQYTNHQYRIWQ